MSGLLNDMFGRYRVDRRTDGALGDWARKYKWSYMRRDDQWADHFEGLPHFRDNDGKQAWHILRGGHRGYRVDAFHYFWLRKDRDDRDRITFHKYKVVNVLIPRERATLTVTRERLGFDTPLDLDLESIEFNRTFRTKVDRGHEKFAYDVLHPRMMEFLLADRRAVELRWPFRFERGDLYTWEEWDKPLDMRLVMQKADFLIDILERVPEFVWKD
jgi:hypothetical protein